VTVFGRANHLGMLLATQTNSAFYPQRDGTWVLAKVRWCCAAAGRNGSFPLVDACRPTSCR